MLPAFDKLKELMQEENKGNVISGKEGVNNTITPARGKASKPLRISGNSCTSFRDADALATQIYDDRTPLVSCLSPI